MYKLFPLPFKFSDLEPYIDTHTLGLHYYKHTLSYLNNLNKIVNKYNYNYKLVDLYNNLEKFKEDKNDLIFYLGGVLNHYMYFECINPFNKELPNEYLLNLINRKYESIDNLWIKIKDLSKSIKGSGYIFLVYVNKDLDLWLLLNQDSPYLYDGIPLLTIDLWEHAYYINYNTDRDKYIDTIKELANYKFANHQLKYMD